MDIYRRIAVWRGWRTSAPRETWLAGLLIATLVAILMARGFVVYRDHSASAPMDNYLLESLAAGLGGFVVTFALAIVAVFAGRLPRVAHVVAMVAISGVLVGYYLLLLANIVAVLKLGRLFDLFWLTYLGTDNAEAMGTYLSAALSRQLLVVLAVCVIVPAAVAAYTVRRTRASPAAVAVAAVTLALIGQLAIEVSPENPRSAVVRKVRDDPGLHAAYGSLAHYRLLRATSGMKVDGADWAMRPVRALPGIATPGADIVLVTMDSVPYQRVADAIAGRSDRMPVLARLAREGRSYTNIYATYPASGASLMSTITSLYPPAETLTGDAYTLRERRVETFPQALGRAGYRTGLFMSGELLNYGISSFIERHPLDETVDNATLHCAGDRRERAVLYNHPGDDCLADAGLRWAIQNKGRQPYFLWLWLNGTHYPYFSTANPINPTQGEGALRFDNALRDADAALGRLVEGLRRAGRLDRTILLVTADHGEAFGEHGMRMHGTSIFDEQVRVPLVISGKAMAGLPSADLVGSLVDLGPTILQFAGATHTGMQGRGLFDPARGRRAYFFCKAGGLTIGYREGRMKYLLDLGDDRLVAYDLSRDPGENRALELSAERDQQVRVRLSAFLRYRDSLRWAALPPGKKPNLAQIARSQRAEQGVGAF